MMMINKSPLAGPMEGAPFLFRKRDEKIDWRRLAAVDVSRVASQRDIDTLQEILTSVVFCDITSEIDTRHVDTNFIKLFQLAQLLVEYLLYSQEYLSSSVDTLKAENEELKKNIEQLQGQLVEKSNRLTIVRRECHRRRLLLLAQQQLMDSGPQSYHRCMYCTKAFLNASFLAAHVHRRHPETECVKQAAEVNNNVITVQQPFVPYHHHEQQQQQQQQQQQLQTRQQQQAYPAETAQVQNSNTTATLERDVRELLEQLKSFNERRSPPTKQVMFMNPSVPAQPTETTKTDEEEPSKPDWQTVMMEEHRRDMELLRNMFEKELRALQVQHASTQDELAQLKLKRAASNLGELVDDVPTSQARNEPLSGPIAIKEMSPIREASLSEAPIPRQKTTEQTSSNVTADVVQFADQIKPPHDMLDHSIQAQNRAVVQRMLPLKSCISIQSFDNEYSDLPVRRRPVRNHSLEPPVRKYSYSDEDEDDKAESDITYPGDPETGRVENVRFRRTVLSHDVKRYRDKWDQDLEDYDYLDGTCQNGYNVRRKHKRRHRHIRVRSAAIQVGQGRNQNERQTNVAVTSVSGDDPVFLRVRRPYSRSGSSASASSSRSPGIRRMRATSIDGRSREIVIVRTEDEDGSGDRKPYDPGSDRSSLRSVHLMPTPTVLGRRSSIQRERIVHVGASTRSSLPERNTPPSVKPVSVYDEPTLSASKASIGTEARTISDRGSKHSASSPFKPNTASHSDIRTASEKPCMSHSPRRASVNQVAETDDTADESDNEQISRATGHNLSVSGASSPVPSMNVSTNVLRYSRLLEQLKSDPETLRGLRHEVEQLLLEQLSERGIPANETRLTTTALNDRLLVLRRERENLAKKHPDFFAIREALAQYVDRLANAMFHGKYVHRTSSSELRSVPSRLQRASVIARSGLPPPAVHSPIGARKGGTLPMQPNRHRPESSSRLGSSMPALGQNEGVSRGGKLFTSPSRNFDGSKPYFQRSSPHLPFRESHPDELHSSRSGISTASPLQGSDLEALPVENPRLHSREETPPPRKAHSSPQRSRSTASPGKTPEISPALKSPSIQLSHDHRVLTFNRSESLNKPTVPTSSDEWDSEPDEPLITATKPMDPGVTQMKLQPAANLAPDVLGSGVDLDEADRFLNELSERQRNSNALFTQDNPVVAPMPIPLNRAHSVRTDDEDICSVSSLNGGVAEDTSLSFLPGTPTRRESKSNTPRVSRSLDPNVAAAKAQAAALGPRPGTRFGPSSRNSITLAGSIPASIGSPDMTNTLATSLWGTNSKAVSLSTNLNGGLKTENVDDADFDTDE